ncbi:EGF-like domain protein [Teladorsagia circumcincta]|uniref:EGF-like domain protein n=1 Tax=Teladorsagia circumcincta TaxID=45464 RepID=A0A2G9UW93_TELCI|nr:EGF-like domain protein [Teladorsagia circumcincta]
MDMRVLSMMLKISFGVPERPTNKILEKPSQYHRNSSCDPTAIEKQNGVTRENRCTSLRNGICIAPEGIALCDCFPGYVGEHCEIYDPCARNPCGKSTECVAIPDETEVKGDLSSQNYRCLCGMGDDIDEQNPTETKCVYSGTGNCSRAKNPCNRGECLSCHHSAQGDVLQLCNENEKKDGFRCICEPGFKPPYCEAPADACFNHLCINGAQCVAKSPFNYDCKCIPGTSGTLCEYVYDYCEAIGNRVCIHGDCYEDPTSTRQFSCKCRFMYYGRNCDRQWSIAEANAQWVMENSNVVFPAFFVLCTFMMLFVVYIACLNRTSRSDEKEDDHEGPESIRLRKIKVAFEQKKNIIRRKRDADRLLALAKKLQTPTKAEQITAVTLFKESKMKNCGNRIKEKQTNKGAMVTCFDY